MLTVLIETSNHEEALARTLASLVGAAVEGAVREVIVCDLGSSDRTDGVADQAGCRYLASGGIAAGIAEAKSDWLLLLEPGARLVDGWEEAVLEHVEMMAMPARFSRSHADRPPFLARIFSSRRALSEGLLIRKAQVAATARHAGNAEAIARGLATKRLRAEIRVAPPL
jgi:hypothetical protein